MNKRGISDVVTTVLIVLLSIVAIAILWGFLQPMFTKSGGKIQQAEACLTVNLEVASCSAIGNVANVTVKRNPGAVNLKEIKLIFSAADGTTAVVNGTGYPEELGSKVYANNNVGFKATGVSVAAGIADSQGIVSYCSPTQQVVCR